VEVAIFERGVPPQFRVYPTDAEGNPIKLNQVQLVIELHRLDRVDTIGFHPSGDYLLGDQTVVEPHSFDMTLRAQWKGNDYEWKHSQIEARAELSDEAIKNAGIQVKTAGPEKLRNVLQLTGEIGLNEEKVVHIVPRLDALVLASGFINIMATRNRNVKPSKALNNKSVKGSDLNRSLADMC